MFVFWCCLQDLVWLNEWLCCASIYDFKYRVAILPLKIRTLPSPLLCTCNPDHTILIMYKYINIVRPILLMLTSASDETKKVIQ